MEITWKSEIVESLKSLGGEATLEEIYEEVKARDNKVITKTYQNTIRGTIYKKSSDSQDFQGGEDLFYTVDGKGNGR